MAPLDVFLSWFGRCENSKRRLVRVPLLPARAPERVKSENRVPSYYGKALKRQPEPRPTLRRKTGANSGSRIRSRTSASKPQPFSLRPPPTPDRVHLVDHHKMWSCLEVGILPNIKATRPDSDLLDDIDERDCNS